jgi:WD40 repeat protein
LNTPAGDSPMPSKIYFWSDDKIEITFPINCIMRRATAADASKSPAPPPSDSNLKPSEHERPTVSPHRLLTGHYTAIRALAFSPDGRRLASCSQESARLWELNGKKKTQLRTGKESIYGVAFVNDGQTLVTAGGKALDPGTIKQWDAATGHEKGMLRKSKWTASEGVAVSPDGKLLVWDESPLVLWDVDRAAERGKPDLQAGLMVGLSFSRDGKKFAGLERQVGGVQVWSVERPTARPVDFRIDKPTCLAWLPDSATLAVGSENKTVTLRDSTTKSIRNRITGLPDKPRGVAVSPDGKVLAVACPDAIRCYDPATGRELAMWKPDLRQPHYPGCLVFSPDGKKLASGSIHATEPGTIAILDVEALLKSKS